MRGRSPFLIRHESRPMGQAVIRGDQDPDYIRSFWTLPLCIGVSDKTMVATISPPPSSLPFALDSKRHEGVCGAGRSPCGEAAQRRSHSTHTRGMPLQRRQHRARRCLAVSNLAHAEPNQSGGHPSASNCPRRLDATVRCGAGQGTAGESKRRRRQEDAGAPGAKARLTSATVESFCPIATP
ncbi:hypothetical protein BKA81DRAFT_104697 [Phyllosticta paracitricarpa]